jgi:hypothetical protein
MWSHSRNTGTLINPDGNPPKGDPGSIRPRALTLINQIKVSFKLDQSGEARDHHLE